VLAYSFEIALASLRRDVALTLLIALATATGIGTSVSVLAVLRGMSGDPIPSKSAQLFAPQIEDTSAGDPNGSLPEQLSYPDAIGLQRDGTGVARTAMYAVQFTVLPPTATPFVARGRAANSDFFRMFNAPWAAGGVWSRVEENERAHVVVLGASLAQRLFGNASAIGQTINLDEREYRVVGVLKPWELQPRVYDVTARVYAETEDVFLPLTTAIELHLQTQGALSCGVAPPPGWESALNSDCRWLQFWVELPDAAHVVAYRRFLDNYAAEKHGSTSRRAPRTALSDSREWLVLLKIVPPEMRVSTLMAFGFLLVCLANAVALMLARFSVRLRDLSVRRALGASRAHVFMQCLAESALMGFMGGVMGVGLVVLGVTIQRSILRDDYARLVHVDAVVVATTVGLGVVAAICSGIYPAWVASRVAPAWQLKTS
jgi:putative ABC transport system permease protein